MHTLPHLPDIGQNLEGGYFNFRIPGQFLIKENCCKSRTSDDIDMKPGPVTKLDKKIKITLINFNVGVRSKNCDVIVIFLIYGQFGATRKPDSGRIVCKT